MQYLILHVHQLFVAQGGYSVFWMGCQKNFRSGSVLGPLPRVGRLELPSATTVKITDNCLYSLF